MGPYTSPIFNQKISKFQKGDPFFDGSVTHFISDICNVLKLPLAITMEQAAPDKMKVAELRAALQVTQLPT